MAATWDTLERAASATAKSAAGESTSASTEAATRKPDPVELARGAETNTWCISLAMLCMELEKKIGLNAPG